MTRTEITHEAGGVAIAERALVGAALLQPAVVAEARAIVAPEDFGSRRLGAAWSAALELAPAGNLEPLHLEAALNRAGERVDLAEIVAWSDEVVMVSHAPAHARLIRDASRRRKLLLLAHQIVTELRKQVPTEDVIASIIRALGEVSP